jgi:hypothetical protein
MDRYLTLITLIFSLLRIQPTTADLCASNERACIIAKDIVSAVDAAPELPFGGPAAKEASDVALLAIAYHESGLRLEVQDCSYCDKNKERGACDHGRSLTMYQVMRGRAWGGHTREELCTDNQLASRLALGVLTRASRGGPQAMFQAYAGCSARNCKAGRELQDQFRALATRAKLAPRGGPRNYVLMVPKDPALGIVAQRETILAPTE